ncbi:hypothetical protein ACFQE8_20430 [Salinirubellus sp. GCM10025818]|jgi:uncharacterized membrane protein|uniref:hypothetical protein n=1 Tax=Salinirubellus TaxID=2162630 RepID=UPI0030D06675
MAYTEQLYDRPGLTGLLLGIVLRFAGDFVGAQVNLVALLLFSFGVVVAIWADDWWSRPGQAMSVAGAFVILVAAVGELLVAL